MFAAYLLVDTLLQAVLNDGNWNEISCDGGQSEVQEAIPVTGNSAFAADGQVCYPPPSTVCIAEEDVISVADGELCYDDGTSLVGASITCVPITDFDLPDGTNDSDGIFNAAFPGEVVQSTLSDAGISVVSSGSCTNPQNPTCTGLDGMRAQTVGAIINVDQACPDCGLVVTAGTEVGHTNSCHQQGRCADIDCRPNACTVDQINRVDQAASSIGTNAVYEVRTQARKDELVAAGANPSAISVVSWITGEHFSLYTN